MCDCQVTYLHKQQEMDKENLNFTAGMKPNVLPGFLHGISKSDGFGMITYLDAEPESHICSAEHGCLTLLTTDYSSYFSQDEGCLPKLLLHSGSLCR